MGFPRWCCFKAQAISSPAAVRGCVQARLYRERNLIERFFFKLKHYRRMTIRYDKLAVGILAMVQRASMRLWLRPYESTA